MKKIHEIFKEEIDKSENHWLEDAEYMAASIKKNYPEARVADIISEDWREYLFPVCSEDGSVQCRSEKAECFRYWFGNFVSLMLQDFFPESKDKKFRRDFILNRPVLPFDNDVELEAFKDKLAGVMDDAFAKVELEIGTFRSGFSVGAREKNKGKIETLITDKSINRIEYIWGTVMLLAIIHFEFIYEVMSAKNIDAKKEMKDWVASLMWFNSVAYWLLDKKQKTTAQKGMAKSKNEKIKFAQNVYTEFKRSESKYISWRERPLVKKSQVIKEIEGKYFERYGKKLKRTLAWYDTYLI